MEGVSFDEEPSALPSSVSRPSAMVRFLLSTKIVSTEKDAEYVLLGVAALAVVIGVSVFLSSGPTRVPFVPVEITNSNHP